MKNVTRLLNSYRECVRNLWNIYFLEQMSQRNEWDLSDEYEKICNLLFSSLVLRHIEQLSYKKSLAYQKVTEPIPIFQVVPSVKSGVPIYINRDMPPSGYWDYPIKIIKPSDADFQFIDFFDFDIRGFREFQYCRVRIVGSKVYSKIIGRDALIESNNVKIILESKEKPGKGVTPI